jgi:hypothetical protein
MEDKKNIKNLIKEALSSFLEQDINVPGERKATVVKFDSSSQNPWEVKFTERGFLIGGTRLSFEELEHAISKEYSIELKDGTKLDAVKMQKILKYKELY